MVDDEPVGLDPLALDRLPHQADVESDGLAVLDQQVVLPAMPNQGAEQTVSSQPFELKANRNVKITAAANVNNSWADLDDTLTVLRELAQGIHPALVSDAGLVGALEALAQRPGVPVELSIDLPERLPEPVEIGAYYVVSEALANANKYARAGRVLVQATVTDDVLHLVVADDGGGGAAARTGSGLEGLADRVSALAGTFDIDSPPGQGTTLTAELPLRASVCTPERP